MKPSRIDWAPPGATRMVHGMPYWAWPLLVTGLVGCLLAGVRWMHDQQRLGPVQEEGLALSERLAHQRAPARRPSASPLSAAQLASINASIRQLNVPWTELLDALEEATGEGVALVELSPDAAQHTLRAVAEARTTDAMIAYLERLRAQPFFIGAALTRHEINEQDPNKPVRFEFGARWREATP